MFASSAHGSSFPKSDGKNSIGNCATIGLRRKPPRLKRFDRGMVDENDGANAKSEAPIRSRPLSADDRIVEPALAWPLPVAERRSATDRVLVPPWRARWSPNTMLRQTWQTRPHPVSAGFPRPDLLSASARSSRASARRRPGSHLGSRGPRATIRPQDCRADSLARSEERRVGKGGGERR